MNWFDLKQTGFLASACVSEKTIVTIHQFTWLQCWLACRSTDIICLCSELGMNKITYSQLVVNQSSVRTNKTKPTYTKMAGTCSSHGHWTSPTSDKWKEKKRSIKNVLAQHRERDFSCIRLCSDKVVLLAKDVIRGEVIFRAPRNSHTTPEFCGNSAWAKIR